MQYQFLICPLAAYCISIFQSPVVAESVHIHHPNLANSSKPEVNHSCLGSTSPSYSPITLPAPGTGADWVFLHTGAPNTINLHSSLVTSSSCAHVFSPSHPSQPYLSSMAVLHFSTFSCFWSCTAFPHEGRRTGCLVRAVAEGLSTGSGWIMS